MVSRHVRQFDAQIVIRMVLAEGQGYSVSPPLTAFISLSARLATVVLLKKSFLLKVLFFIVSSPFKNVLFVVLPFLYLSKVKIRPLSWPYIYTLTKPKENVN